MTGVPATVYAKTKEESVQAFWDWTNAGTFKGHGPHDIEILSGPTQTSDFSPKTGNAGWTFTYARKGKQSQDLPTFNTCGICPNWLDKKNECKEGERPGTCGHSSKNAAKLETKSTMELPLTKDLVAIVDGDDFESLSKWKWTASQTKKDGSKPYALRTVIEAPGEKHHLYLHRAIWEMHNGPVPQGKQIDHANGDCLDNRKANLRLCDQSQNNANQVKTRGLSKYKGVTWNEECGKWQGQIQKDNEHESLGLFDSEEEAAKAYDERARELFGEFARTNFHGAAPGAAFEVETSKVMITGFNPRKRFDDDTLLELASSIMDVGLIEPILVRPKGSKYELVVGERRLRAIRDKLRYPTIAAIVREMTDEQVLDAMIAENVCREDLNPIEEANHLKRMLEVGKITQAELAARIGKSQEWVSGRLSLAEAPANLQDMIIARAISPSAAIDLLAHKDKSWFQAELDIFREICSEDEPATVKAIAETVAAHMIDEAPSEPESEPAVSTSVHTDVSTQVRTEAKPAPQGASRETSDEMPREEPEKATDEVTEEAEPEVKDEGDPDERRVITRAQYALVKRALFLTPNDAKEPTFDELERAGRPEKEVLRRYKDMPSNNTAKRELLEWAFPWLEEAA
jgi:ParB/RepB/Spo0J family partition protein